jgi:hypothetical protein
MATNSTSYKITIRHARDRYSEPLFLYPFLADTVEDFERGLREAIFLWKQVHPGEYPLEDGYTLLIEKA